MKDFVTYMPTKIHFGCGMVNKVADIAEVYGKKVMLVTTGKDMENLGILKKVLDPLTAADMEILIYDDVEPNPKTYHIDKGVEIFNTNKCDFTIALGGGSAMDAAKAIAVVAKNGGSIRDYITGGKRQFDDIRQSYPCICITTTSGTGSEATQYSVITIPETHEKPGFGFDCMYPDASIVDPELMIKLPKGITAQTGVDVFFHAMEAYITTVATPFVDVIAIDTMKTVAANLEKVLETGEDIEARSKMAWANTMGGTSIALTATIGIHALGHSISGITDIPHGRALSSVAPAFLKYTWDADIERYGNVARILGAPVNLSDKEAASQCGDLLEKFLEKAEIGHTLTSIGFPEDKVEMIADVTLSSMKYGVDVSLKKLEREDLIKILNMAM